MSVDSAETDRSQPDTVRDGMESIFRLFAGIGAAVFRPTKYFLRPSYPAPTENLAEDTAATAGAIAIAPVTADVNVGLDARIGCDAQSAPDTQEIERRRNLVRTLFNDFWSGAHDKPTAFAKRLDQAEDYLNERLAANGEFWRLDNNTRAVLGLPPRSK
jgi:hypothetical protein